MSEKNVYQIVDEKLVTVMEECTQKIKDTSGGLALSTNQYAKFYTVPNYDSEECIQFKDTYIYNSLSKSEVMTFTTDFDGYIKQEYKTNANSSSSISLNNSYAKVTVNDITILNIQLKDGITTWIFPVKSGDQVETIVRTGYDGQDGCDFFKAYKIPFSLTIPSIETLPSGSSGSQGETGADSYSITETQTSKTWIDGKPIYRKVVIKKNSSNTSFKSSVWTQLNFDGMPENMDSIVNASIVGGGAITPKAKYNITFSVNSDGIYYYSSVATNYTNLWLILEYTKTTD